MSNLWSMLKDSYAVPDSISPHDTLRSPTVNRGSATDKQLSYIKKLSGGSGDFLAEQRFGKYLSELTASEASMMIETLRK